MVILKDLRKDKHCEQLWLEARAFTLYREQHTNEIDTYSSSFRRRYYPARGHLPHTCLMVVRANDQEQGTTLTAMAAFLSTVAALCGFDRFLQVLRQHNMKPSHCKSETSTLVYPISRSDSPRLLEDSEVIVHRSLFRARALGSI